jgi:hypothetical protein
MYVAFHLEKAKTTRTKPGYSVIYKTFQLLYIKYLSL